MCGSVSVPFCSAHLLSVHSATRFTERHTSARTHTHVCHAQVGVCAQVHVCWLYMCLWTPVHMVVRALVHAT